MAHLGLGTPPPGNPMTHPLQFTAYGRTAPQGSKLRTRYGMVDDNTKTLTPWRRTIATAAAAAMNGRPPLDGPLAIRITLTLPKPKSAPKRRTTWPTARGNGDLDKYVRAIFDALTTGGAWTDDVQVVELTAAKRYPGEGPEALYIPGATITVWPITAPEGATP